MSSLEEPNWPARSYFGLFGGGSLAGETGCGGIRNGIPSILLGLEPGEDVAGDGSNEVGAL